MIEQSTVDRVMAAADIVDVVKDFVALRKAGASYKGLCPFHEDRTPSFIVTPAKGLCKCFACGAGGNAVKFVQMHEQLSWPEAIRYLARKYGIEVEERGVTDGQRERSREREALLVLNEWACEWFQTMLHDDPDGIAIGMSYFRSRGFRDDTIRKFQLGFCPDRRDAMSQAAVKAGYGERLLVNDEVTLQGTGLSFKNDKGGLTDRFRGRVMFPIHSVSGRVVGFGGRVLAKETKGVGQKYVNSPGSLIYSKSRELYGLYQAKQAIVKQDCCYLVEGYTDVISMHQSGVENVVASSGTALTEGQIALLHRFTGNVTLLYDGDEAGRHAALRGTDMLLSQGLNIKVLLLPEGEDPDSFARSHRGDEFRRYIARNEVDFIRFKTDILLKDSHGDPVKKAEAVADIVDSIAVIPDDILRQTYAHECAEQLQMAESVIVKAIRDRRSRSLLPRSAEAPPVQKESSERGSAQTDSPAQDTAATSSPNESGNRDSALTGRHELALAAAVIRWGGLSFPVSAEKEEANVTRFITDELATDGIVLSQPLCHRVFRLAEEMLAGEVPEQKAWVQRFLMSEDEAVAGFAEQVTSERHTLSQSQQQRLKPDEDSLHTIVPRLIYELKYVLISEQVKAIQQQIRKPETQADAEALQTLLADFRDLSAIQKEIGRTMGGRVMKK